ncbi:MAG: hypothetical protein ACI4U2_05730 [Christensenellaceae bacterium]
MFLGSSIASILLAINGKTDVQYRLCYTLSAIALGSGIFLFVVWMKHRKQIRSSVLLFMRRRVLTGRFVDSYDFRALVLTVPAFCVTIAYAVYNGYLGIVHSSIWFGALAGYYALLVLMRGSVLQVSRARHSSRLSSIRCYLACGVILLILTIALSVAIVQMIVANATFEKPGLLIYAAATYTFYKIGMAVVHVVKAKKSGDYITQTIRNVGLCDAAVSVLALQTAMFQAFSEPGAFERTMNALTGGAVCLIAIVTGSIMIVRGAKQLRKEKEHE